MRGDDWRRYAAPAAFLLAATIAIVLIRSGVESGRRAGAPPASSVPSTLTVTLTRSTATTTTTAQAPSPGRRYWTVRAGDTFGLISAQSGVPVATIEQLNPTVKSTSLFIGEKIRLR